LHRVGLGAGIAHNRSTQFSGGERARLAIARALAAMSGEPGGLLILDESLAALDDATRDGILALLRELRLETGLAMLLVSHNPETLERAVERVISI
jgi:peptide/nickel transport system ATP-binding protein